MKIDPNTGQPLITLEKSGIEISLEYLQEVKAWYGYDLNDLAIDEVIEVKREQPFMKAKIYVEDDIVKVMRIDNG